MLQQGRENGMDLEWSASESDGGESNRPQTTAGYPPQLSGPVCGNDAPNHEGGDKMWRRVRVYKEGSDSWEMGTMVEQDGDRCRITYTRGGSEWIILPKSSVLEQAEVVWAKMGRKYPWWPAQILREIGIETHQKKNEQQVTVEWLGEQTVAQVSISQVLPYEAHLEEHRASLVSGKKIFGFQKSLVRVAFEEASQRLNDIAHDMALHQSRGRHHSRGDIPMDLLDQAADFEFLGGPPGETQHFGPDDALASMHQALGAML